MLCSAVADFIALTWWFLNTVELVMSGWCQCLLAFKRCGSIIDDGWCMIRRRALLPLEPAKRAGLLIVDENRDAACDPGLEVTLDTGQTAHQPTR